MTLEADVNFNTNGLFIGLHGVVARARYRRGRTSRF